MRAVFADRLSKLRTAKKLTQQDIANKLGITRQAYSFYETGKREPDYETLKKLVDLFEVSIDYLLGRSNDPSNVEEDEEKHNIAFFGGAKEELTEEESKHLQESLEMFRLLKEKRLKEKRDN